jgi:hypothetical protein
MASRIVVPDLPSSPAHDAVKAIAVALLEPTTRDFKSHREVFEMTGVTVTGLYEKDLRTKMVRAINFDIETPEGTVRLGSSAFAAAAFCYAVAMGANHGASF